MRTRIVVVLMLSCGLGLSCSGDTKKSGALVAKGSGVQITTAEFQARLDEQSPLVRARYSTRERKKEFLENLIRFELLTAEAKRQGLDKDPEVQATLQKILVQRLVRKAFDDAKAGAATEEEIKKYYDEHLEEFVRPERIRVSQIFLRADRGSADRGARAAEARKLLARLKAEEPKNPLVFSVLAREVSDDPRTKLSGGDLGFRTRADLESAQSKELAAAAFALVKAGDVSGIIESERGFHILKLTVRQPALNRTFDEARAQIAARLSREVNAKQFDAFVAKLRETAKIEIIDEELDNVHAGAQPGSAESAAAATSANPVPSPSAAK